MKRIGLGISLEAYKEICKEHKLKGHELRKMLRQHKKEGCCPSCIEDKLYGYDTYPYCCCKLADMIKKTARCVKECKEAE
jgi:hypothetical protein